jgi:hypothetical protein
MLPNKAFILTTIFIMVPVLSKAFPENPYHRIPMKFVDELQSSAENRIVIISTRNFKPADGYKVTRGLQPKFKSFHFVGGKTGDSVYLKPQASLAPALDDLPLHRDFLVYVDGHGKTFDQILERGFEVSRRFNINLVIFDWPTDYLALRKTAYNADEIAPTFVSAMADLDHLIRRSFSQSAISVMFHSMGNHILKNIVDQRLQDYLPHNMFSNIIMNAAAVKQFRHNRWVGKLHIQDRIYITINDEDRPLHGAMVLRMARQLGTGYKGNPAGNAIYVNFSEIATIEHNLFLGRSEAEIKNAQIYRFYQEALQGNQVDLIRKPGFRDDGELVYFAVPVEGRELHAN